MPPLKIPTIDDMIAGFAQGVPGAVEDIRSKLIDEAFFGRTGGADVEVPVNTPEIEALEPSEPGEAEAEVSRFYDRPDMDKDNDDDLGMEGLRRYYEKREFNRDMDREQRELDFER